MRDYAAEVQRLRDAITHYQRVQARAEHEHKTAEAAAEKARQALKDEFGVDTPADAKRTLAALEAELQTAIDSLANDLDLIGG